MASARVMLAVATLFATAFTPQCLANHLSNVSDVDILQFALNLVGAKGVTIGKLKEYLEANFYSCAAYGKPIDASLTGGGPAPTGCKKAKLSAYATDYAKTIANDEIAHVKFLRSALSAAGVTPVNQPALNIGSAFAAAADAAFGAKLSPPFDAYANDVLFFLASYIFEDVGVTAYNGAAPLLKNKAYLAAAAGIMAAEAYHAGAIRTLLYQHAKEVLPNGVTVAYAVKAISALRDSAGGTKIDKGITEYGTLKLVPADANAIVYSRTFAQVLTIVYLGAPNWGGFFPKALNGYIQYA